MRGTSKNEFWQRKQRAGEIKMAVGSKNRAGGKLKKNIKTESEEGVEEGCP